MNNLVDRSPMMTTTMAAQKEPMNPSIDQRMQRALERVEDQIFKLRQITDRLCGAEVPRGQEVARPPETRGVANNIEPIRASSVFEAIDSSIDHAHYLADRISNECERIAAKACIPG